MEKTVIILRALPGSGKSFLAGLITRHHPSSSIINIDRYFYNEKGEYVYDPKDTETIHKNLVLAQTKFDHAMEMNIELIVIDCVNETKKHVDGWRSVAEKNGYHVVIAEIPHIDPSILAARNTKNVPEERIRKKMIRWEYLGYDLPIQRCIRKIKRFFINPNSSW